MVGNVRKSSKTRARHGGDIFDKDKEMNAVQLTEVEFTSDSCGVIDHMY